jgi:hypothetical protein
MLLVFDVNERFNTIPGVPEEMKLVNGVTERDAFVEVVL